MEIRPSVIIGFGAAGSEVLDLLRDSFRLLPPQVSEIVATITVAPGRAGLSEDLRSARMGVLDQRKLDALGKLEGFTVRVPTYLSRQTCDVYLVADLADPQSDALSEVATAAYAAFTKPIIGLALLPDSHQPGKESQDLNARLSALEGLACGDVLAKVFLASRELEDVGILPQADLLDATAQFLSLLVFSSFAGDEALRTYLQPVPAVTADASYEYSLSGGSDGKVALNYATFGLRTYAFPVMTMRRIIARKLAHLSIRDQTQLDQEADASGAKPERSQGRGLLPPKMAETAAPLESAVGELSQILEQHQGALNRRPFLSDHNPAVWHNEIATWDTELGIWYVGKLRRAFAAFAEAKVARYGKGLGDDVDQLLVSGSTKPVVLKQWLEDLEGRQKTRAREESLNAAALEGHLSSDRGEVFRNDLRRLGGSMSRSFPLFVGTLVSALGLGYAAMFIRNWVGALSLGPLFSTLFNMGVRDRPPAVTFGLLVFLVVAVLGAVNHTVGLIVTSGRLKAKKDGYLQEIVDKYAHTGNALLHQTLSGILKQASEVTQAERTAVTRLVGELNKAESSLREQATARESHRSSTTTCCLDDVGVAAMAGHLVEDAQAVLGFAGWAGARWKSVTAKDLTERALDSAEETSRELVQKAFAGYLTGEHKDATIQWGRQQLGHVHPCLRLPRIVGILGTPPASAMFWATESPTGIEGLPGEASLPFVTTSDPYRLSVVTIRQCFALAEIPWVAELREAIAASSAAEQAATGHPADQASPGPGAPEAADQGEAVDVAGETPQASGPEPEESIRGEGTQDEPPGESPEGPPREELEDEPDDDLMEETDDGPEVELSPPKKRSRKRRKKHGHL